MANLCDFDLRGGRRWAFVLANHLSPLAVPARGVKAYEVRRLAVDVEPKR